MLPEFIRKPDPSIFLSDNYVVLDFETTNIDRGSAIDPSNKLVMACWYSPKYGMKTCYKGEMEQEELCKDIRAADFVVAHNAKFELQWLKRCGIDLHTVLSYCTQIGEYVKHGNTLAGKLRSQSLDATAARYGLPQKENLVSKLIKGGVCPSEIPKSWLIKYCRKDVELCARVFKIQREILDESGKLPTQFTRCIATPCLADIEFRGLCLDKKRVYEEYDKYNRLFLETERELEQMTGGINMNSPIQVAEYLYDVLGFKEVTDRRGRPIRNKPTKRFPDGAPKIDKRTMDSLKATNKKQRDFVALRKKRNHYNALLTKSLHFFKGVVDEKEHGIFYGQLHQTNTQTHRLASTGRTVKFEQYPKNKQVQFQNLPRIFKRLFKSRRKGWKVAEIDGAQLEFRIAAYLGQDEVAVDDIRRDVDVHSVTGSVIYRVDESDVSSEQRTASKAHTFKPLFGGMSGTKDEKRYYKFFREKYNQIASTQKRWVYDVVRDKKLTTCTGLEFFWPDTKVTPSGYVINNESIHNYPIQSLATAEIIPVAVVYLWHRIIDSGANMFITNTVHDSAILEIPEDEEDLFKEIGNQAFIHDVYFYLNTVYGLEFNVPLGTGIKISNHWGDTKEEETTAVEPPVYTKEAI